MEVTETLVARADTGKQLLTEADSRHMEVYSSLQARLDELEAGPFVDTAKVLEIASKGAGVSE